MRSNFSLIHKIKNSMNYNKLIIVLIIIFLNIDANAQKYYLAGGLRYGSNLGLTISELVYDKVTLEQDIISSYGDLNYSGFLLGRYHQHLISSRFNLFFGGGLGVFRLKSTQNSPAKTVFGPALKAGLELTVSRITISASLEPVYYNSRKDDKFFIDKAISAKYVFIKKPSKISRQIKKALPSKKKDHWWEFKKKKK